MLIKNASCLARGRKGHISSTEAGQPPTTPLLSAGTGLVRIPW